MLPGVYINRFRKIAAISLLTFGIIAIVLLSMSVIPRHELVPIIAIIIGSLPLLVFKLFTKVECPRCKHKMKLYSKFPHVIYKCTRCSHIVNTNGQ